MTSKQHPLYLKHEYRCSFCNIGHEDVESLIASPHNQLICSNCVEKYYPSPPAESLFVSKKRKKRKNIQSLTEMMKDWIGLRLETLIPRPRCSFCARHYDECGYLIVSHRGVFICNYCLKICISEITKFREKSAQQERNLISNKRENKFAVDKHRPVYHFLPPQNWMNDPNGLIQWQGKYHLFYQHNPYDAVWGNMTWGHAISDDLLHWRDMPFALERTPDSYDANGIFSGCTVNNNGVATILYTGTAGIRNEVQTVCIATSHNEDLRTWQKYEGNPVIAAPPEGFKQLDCFRDPFVWREGEMWYMVIGAGRPQSSEAVLLYRSPDLYQWEYLHPLIESDAVNDDIYECPNFFPLGDKWVLLVSVMPVSHVEYFIGTFDNLHFTVEQRGRLVEGALFAPLSFQDEAGRRIMFGWIPEKRPVEQHQAAGWAGVMSLPLELSLSDAGQLHMTPLADALTTNTTCYEYTDVTLEKLATIQDEIGSLALKVRIGSDFTAYLDHSVIEIFEGDNYHVRRVYDNMGLPCLSEFVSFPIPLLQVWKIDSIW